MMKKNFFLLSCGFFLFLTFWHPGPSPIAYRPNVFLYPLDHNKEKISILKFPWHLFHHEKPNKKKKKFWTIYWKKFQIHNKNLRMSNKNICKQPKTKDTLRGFYKLHHSIKKIPKKFHRIFFSPLVIYEDMKKAMEKKEILGVAEHVSLSHCSEIFGILHLQGIQKNQEKIHLQGISRFFWEKCFSLKAHTMILDLKNQGSIFRHVDIQGEKFPFFKAQWVHGQNNKFKAHDFLYSSERPKNLKEKPLWYFQGKSLEFNEKKGTLKGRHIIFKFKDIPLFYIPFFSKNLKSTSGFLVPTLGGTREKNFYIGLPYCHYFSPQRSITLTPYVFSRTGVMGHGIYGHSGPKGFLEIQGATTTSFRLPENFFFQKNNTLGNRGTQEDLKETHGSLNWHNHQENLRGFLEGKAFFKPTNTQEIFLEEYWASDPSFFYHFPLFGKDQWAYLASNSSWIKYFPQKKGMHYISLESYHYQPLLTPFPNRSPVVFPKIDYFFSRNFQDSFQHIHCSFHGNTGVFFFPQQSSSLLEEFYNVPKNPKEDFYSENLPNTWRISARGELSWKGLSPVGTEFFSALRFQAMDRRVFKASIFSTTPLDSWEFYENHGENFFSSPYFYPQWEASFSHGLGFSSSGSSSFLVVPKAQLLLGPEFFGKEKNGENMNYLLTSDSQNTIFSTGTLFLPNRYGGWDFFDSGSRMNYGLRAQWAFSQGSAHVFVGQSYAFHEALEPLPHLGAPKGFSNIVMTFSTTFRHQGFSYNANIPLKSGDFFSHQWQFFGEFSTPWGPLQWSSSYLFSKDFSFIPRGKNQGFNTISSQHLHESPDFFQNIQREILKKSLRPSLHGENHQEKDLGPQEDHGENLDYDSEKRPSIHQLWASVKVPLSASFFVKAFALMDFNTPIFSGKNQQYLKDPKESFGISLHDDLQEGEYSSEGEKKHHFQENSFSIFLERGITVSYETESLEFGLSVHHYNYRYEALNLQPGFIITLGLRMKNIGHFQSPGWNL